MRRRVVVTGIGAISGAGKDVSEFLRALAQGTDGFHPIRDPRLSHLKSTHHAIVTGDVRSPEDPDTVQCMDRIVHLSLRAAREALHHGGIEGPLGERGAVVIGTCSGGMLSIERHFEALSRQEDILDELLLFSKRYYSTAKVLAWAAGAGGTVKTVVTACAASAGAIAEAALLIRSGRCDIALAGGADTFAASTLLGFDALKATCEGTCTPFSTNIGLNLGEGAGMILLESIDAAQSRGVPILAEILGSGQSNDAYHPTSPDPSCKAQVAALERTLRDAGLTPNAIDYVNAHGTGTRANDAVESRTIAKVLGDHACEIPVSSTKSLIGHCLGAAGALETAATILSAKAGFCPPTLGFDTPREGCGLDYVPDLNRPYTGRVALTNSFGFGGNNACLLIDTSPDVDSPIAVGPGPSDDHPVITGIGVVHPLGLGTAPLLERDTSGIAPMSRLNGDAALRFGGLVPPIDPRLVDRRLDLKGLGALATFGTVATRLALGAASVRPKPSVTAEIGVVMGVSSGDTASESAHLTATFENDFRLDRVESFPFVVQNAAAGQLARALMLKGPSTVISTGWGAGLSALVTASLAVETGQAATVATVGCDLVTERSYLDGLNVGLYGEAPLLTPGEGAACLLVEHPTAAAARGARAIAEILGAAEATDTEDPVRASGKAVVRCLKTAMAGAGVQGAEVSACALTLSGHPIHGFERAAVQAVIPSSSLFSLYPRIGFVEAALPLLNLAVLIEREPPGSVIAAVSCSEQGIASAAILRTLFVK